MKLIYNEEMKIIIRKSTWAMFAILAVIIIGSGLIEVFLGDHQTAPDDNWQQALQDENQQITKENEEYKKEVENDNRPSTIPPSMDKVDKNNYYLDNDIQPKEYGAWQFVLQNKSLSSLVSLFTIIMAGGIVAQEFKWGTIKLLLIRPVSRSQILLSKFAAVILFALVTALFVIVFSWITGAIMFGIEGFLPEVVLQNNILDTSEGFRQTFIVGDVFADYGYKLINLVMMGTFAFMISAVFRNNTLAIGAAIFLMFTGNTIVTAFNDYDWAKYILFANTDLEQYTVSGSPVIEGMTLGFSITMLIVYFAIFIALSWLVFSKRDVAS
ncbi:ABC transporter permease [Barrientosiimonas marina]|uniref:ABC transporter permease n=1 Tax=Lentibacillus kimchii TaxID=1542911 RepID=A0ABW2UVN6_9BACI